MAASTAPVVATWERADNFMDFSVSENAKAWSQKLESFMECYVLPHNPAWHQAVSQGQYPPAFLEDLKALAREEGLLSLIHI